MNFSISGNDIALLRVMVPFMPAQGQIMIETLLTFIDIFNAPEGMVVNPEAIEKLYNFFIVQNNDLNFIKETIIKQPTAEDVVNLIEVFVKNFIIPIQEKSRRNPEYNEHETPESKDPDTVEENQINFEFNE